MLRPALWQAIDRAEHWVVVSGTAKVTRGEEIIEVQSGSYLGEDDIVRFEDSYGR